MSSDKSAPAPLRTFSSPHPVTGTDADRELGRALVRAWQTDGIFQIRATTAQQAATERALAASRAFCARPLREKTTYVSDLTYSGYVASGEEETAGEKDGSEIFTVCPDIPADDPRVIERWPCHGPTPWPSAAYADAMKRYMALVGELGHRLLRLTALGLGLADPDHFTRLTADGWHHMRVLRFPPATAASARGIGSHTDYGLLVIAAQDDVGGLYVRPPVPGEERGRNWLPGESMAGRYEHDEPWTYVTPVPAVFTVFPGDIMQFMTDGALLSTPHKVRLADRERYTLAYFHEPAFNAVARPPGAGGPHRPHPLRHPLHLHVPPLLPRPHHHDPHGRRLGPEDPHPPPRGGPAPGLTAPGPPVHSAWAASFDVVLLFAVLTCVPDGEADMDLVDEHRIDVGTMNGHRSRAVQLLCRRR